MNYTQKKDTSFLMTTSPQGPVQKILFNNFIYIGAIGAGTLCANYFPGLLPYLRDLTEIFQNLFEMCVLPIIICSVIIGIFSLLTLDKSISMKPLFNITMIILFAICAIGLTICFIFNPGSQIDLFADDHMATLITKASILHKGLWDPIEINSSINIIEFLKKSIPSNIFFSLAGTQILQVIVFSIFFAFALSKVNNREVLSTQIELFYKIFKKIFEWVLMLLPVSIFCSIATALSKAKIILFMELLPFLGYVFFYILIVFAINLLALKYVLKTKILTLLRDLKLSLLLGLVSSPISATLPVVNFLKKHGTPEGLTDTLVPIFLFVGTFGNILYFIFSSVVIGQVYEHPFGWVNSLFVSFFSIVEGVSSMGTSIPSSNILINSILNAVGIPSGPIIDLLKSLDFLIFPFLNLISIQTSILLIACFSFRKRKYPTKDV